MPRKYVKSSKRLSRSKRAYKRRFRGFRNNYYSLSRRISAVSKRVAGEVQKFEITPLDFGSTTFSGSSTTAEAVNNPLLRSITSGVPYIFPLNWIYTPVINDDEVYSRGSINLNENRYRVGTTWENISNGTYQYKNPVFYKMITGDINPLQSSELQYRMKYIYINSIFKSETPCRIRFVIVKDKLPTDNGATWFNANNLNRSVFNSNNINAQLNPLSNGRFKIMYDKIYSLTSIQPFKPFKYYRTLSTKIRNSQSTVYMKGYETESLDTSSTNSVFHYFPQQLQTVNSVCPVGKNAFYLMIFSDGASFEYDSTDGTTENNTFKLFSRVSYYNN